MNFKLLITLFACILYLQQGFARKKRNIYYFKKSGKEITEHDSADFIREVSEPDSGTTLFNVAEFYKDGKTKLVGKTSRIEYLQLEGQVMSFYPSGKKKEVAEYKGGKKTGTAYEFFPNGKLHVQKQYLESKANASSDYGANYLIIACSDSTGKELADDGNGYYVGYDKDFKNIDEEGSLQSGLKNGKWKGGYQYKSGKKLTFTEEHNKGKMISGQTIDSNNVVHSYTIRETPPEFKGGTNAFSRYLISTIRYPAIAKENNIQGRVLVGFVVEKDGTLTDFRILSNTNKLLNNEALRI